MSRPGAGGNLELGAGVIDPDFLPGFRLGRRGWRAAAAAIAFGLAGLGGCERGAEARLGAAADSSSVDGAEPTAANASAGGAAAPGPAAVLVDSAQPRAVAGQDGWMYSRAAEADLDGDGRPERVVLTARAEVRERRPLWDDGQPWQVYVEEAGGERTYLYARFVQLGSVTMRIGLGAEGRRPSVVLVEHVPDRLAVYEIGYSGPSEVELVHCYERMLDPTGELSSPALPEY